MYVHAGQLAVQRHELGFCPRDPKHFLHLGVNRYQLFLKGTEKLIHAAFSRS